MSDIPHEYLPAPGDDPGRLSVFLVEKGGM